MVTFHTTTSSIVKKLQISISFENNYRKQCLCYLLILKWWKPRFLISERVFHRFLPNYKEFAHETSHTQPSKYDSTSGTNISICLKKIGGMRLWIGTSTFKYRSLTYRQPAAIICHYECYKPIPVTCKNKFIGNHRSRLTIYNTISMADCSSSFNRNMITNLPLQSFLHIMKPLLSSRLIKHFLECNTLLHDD